MRPPAKVYQNAFVHLPIAVYRKLPKIFLRLLILTDDGKL